MSDSGGYYLISGEFILACYLSLDGFSISSRSFILIISFVYVAEDFSDAAKDVNVAACDLLAESHSPCEEDDNGCKLLFPVEDGVGHFIFKPFLPFYNEEQGFPSSQDSLEWGISQVSVCWFVYNPH